MSKTNEHLASSEVDTHVYRSVPEIRFREMSRAETIRLAGPLQLQWWVRPLNETSQSLLRWFRRPAGQLVVVKCDDDPIDR